MHRALGIPELVELISTETRAPLYEGTEEDGPDFRTLARRDKRNSTRRYIPSTVHSAARTAHWFKSGTFVGMCRTCVETRHIRCNHTATGPSRAGCALAEPSRSRFFIDTTRLSRSKGSGTKGNYSGRIHACSTYNPQRFKESSLSTSETTLR